MIETVEHPTFFSRRFFKKKYNVGVSGIIRLMNQDEASVLTGRVKIEGDLGLAIKMQSLFA